jgi:peptidoglycan hydrolase-like protein with peptidoglycan-binding domain/predicted  nucleic acid-binding Zn-ribbon protein
MAVVIPIITEFVGKGVERAIKEFKQIEGAAGKAAFVFSKAVVPGAIAAAGAATALAGTLFSAAKAAAEAEREDKLLADQLRRTTGASDIAIASALKFVDALEMQSTVSGGELSQALATLTRATGSVATAQEQLTLATDIAIGANLDLNTVSKALSKAYNGEFGALTKLGVPLDENIIKTKDYSAAQKVLTEQFGGAAAGAADTFQGQLAKLGIGIDKIKEGIGQAILPALTDFVARINEKVVPALRVFVEQLGEKGLRGAFVSMAAAFQIAGIDILRVIENISIGFIELAETIIDLGAPLFVIIDLFRAVAARGKAIDSTQKIVDDALNKSRTRFAALRGEIKATAYQMALFSQAATNTNKAVVAAEDRLANFGNKIKAVKPEIEDTKDEVTKLGGGFNAAADKAKKMADRTKEAADVLAKEMADALSGAEENLATAQRSFDDFATSIEKVITDTLDFADAFKASAEEGGGSFFDELQKQADKTKEFGALVEKLLLADISKEALDQVLAAGVESGTEIAKQLLGAADGVLKANTLIAEVQAIADRIGLAGANKFYKAGVDNGAAYLRGVEEAIAAANARIAGAKRPADVKGAGALFNENLGAARAASGVTNVTINAQSLDPKRAGDVIVDALKDYNRRSGPLDILVS